jgi:acetyl-CoA carboxylase carboxyltransferase component
MAGASPAALAALVEAMTRRYYRVRALEPFRTELLGGRPFQLGRYVFEERTRHHAAAYVGLGEVTAATEAFIDYARTLPEDEPAVLDLYAAHDTPRLSKADLATELRAALRDVEVCPSLHRVVVAVSDRERGEGMGAVDLFTFRPGPEGLVEDVLIRGLHPMMGHRLKLWRMSEFELERLPSGEDVYLFHGVARSNPADERLFAVAEVRDLTAVRDERDRVVALPELEQVLIEVYEGIRGFQAHRPVSRRLMWNRVVLHVWPVWKFSFEEIRTLIERLAPLSAGLGLELLEINGRIQDERGFVRERALRLFAPTGRDVAVELADAPTTPLRPLDESARRLIAARRRGTLHPAEVAHLLAPAHASPTQPAGTFTEFELDESGRLAPVDRPPASNPTGIVVGTIRNVTARYPEGMLRVILLGDPTRALGSLAAPECKRINAAIDLATELGVPLEWFALSAGAKIAMDSGTETMDWIADVLRRIVLFTQAGGELNVVVAGINVGAQPYFNAEATMLMHTRGALIMTPDSAMVLTGKQAIDYSGGVSAEDNFGIGGYDRIMGPNGQGQYWAPDLAGACRLLLDYYEHTYVAPGERFPRRAVTTDPASRDAGASPHAAPGSALTTVAQVFADATNPERKQPFDIRSVMRAVIDADHAPLERWGAMRDAESAVVWDAHLGGWPVAMLGIESRPLPRRGQVPADGPDSWTSGTLFPRSSKKIARAINATGGRRPIVVLANLAGFDASPESMREWQLEFGAEIGRAVVNCDGPIVFCVVSRYHGGAFVVFSQLLNPNLETLALEGARASVIGGAPAAAVVFNREVEQTAAADERIVALDRMIEQAEGAERQRLRVERSTLWGEVLARTRGEFAERFDAVHSVDRAVQVGSVKRIISLESIRRELIDAVERGMARALESSGGGDHGAGGGAFAGLAERR